MTSCAQLIYRSMGSKFCRFYGAYIVDNKPHPKCPCSSCETVHEETQGEPDDNIPQG